MFLSMIHLFNYLSHADTTIDFEALTAFRGANGAGKSTVRSGLQYSLTGRCDVTDERGAGAKEMIRRGVDKSAVTLDFTWEKRPVRMRCSLTEKSGRTVQIKDPSDPAWTGTEFLNFLAAKREILDCLANGAYFTEMDDARQQKLLAAIVLPGKVEIDELVKAAINECGIRLDWTLRAFDLILAGETACRNERKLVSRMIEEWPEPIAPEGKAAGDPQEIRIRLAERRAQRDEIVLKRAKIISQFEGAGIERKRLQDAVVRGQQRLTDELERKRQVSADVLSKAKLEEANKTIADSEKATALDVAIAQRSAQIEAAKKQRSSAEGLLSAGQCPTCCQPIGEEFTEKFAMPLIERIALLERQQREDHEQRKILGDPPGAQRQLDAHVAAEKNLALIQKHIAERESEISEAKISLERLGNPSQDAKPDTAAVDAELADIEQRMERGAAALNDAIAANDAKAKYDEALATRKKLANKHEALEKLVAYFGPKGVQATALTDSAAKFEAEMNGFLAGWGFRCSLQFEPYSFRAGLLNSQETFVLKAMSDGQRAMFAAAFQVALAKVTGIGFVCVDAAEVFSEENRVTLFKNLVGAKLEQVIVIAADMRRVIPNRAGTAYYMFSLDGSGTVPTSKVERLTSE